MSRTPVREAMKRLTQDGTVEFLPRRGIYVRKLSRDDVAEIYQKNRILTRVSERMGDGSLDRLVHNAYRIEMEGESMRKKLSPLTTHTD